VDEDRWYTVEEIVGKLQVHEQTVRRWLREGELHGVLLGRKAGWRIRSSEIDRFIAERDTAQMGKAAA
jgi:excisionase family DNA binding protein